MNKKSLFFKTFIQLFLGTILLILLIHLIILFTYEGVYKNNKSEELNRHLNILSGILISINKYNIDSILKNYAKNNQINISLKTGKDVKYYQGHSLFIKCFFENDSDIQLENIETVESIKIKTRKIQLQNKDRIEIQLVANMQSLQESKKIVLAILPYSILISFLFSLLFAFIYSKTLTNPIKKMSKIVNQMTQLNSDLKINISQKNELGKLADDINLLYSQLLLVIKNYKEKNQYIVNIEKERLNFFRASSHELKTPLAKLSILIENMQYNIGKYKDRDKYLAQSLSVVTELSKMISDLLETVKNDKFKNENITELSIKKNLLKILAEYEIIAKSKKIEIQTELYEDFSLNMRSSDLEKVLSNIISNAIKYVVQNGYVKISLTNNKLEIYNDSLLIPQDTMKNIWKGNFLLPAQNSFLKNQKLEEKNSNGLGLYIVKNILEQYNISYSFEKFNKGYKFIIKK